MVGKLAGSWFGIGSALWRNSNTRDELAQIFMNPPGITMEVIFDGDIF
jgi:hypothetical protein